MQGTLAGTDGWFNNPRSQVSAHYGVGLFGEIHQYVNLSNAAWANGVLEPGNDWNALLLLEGRADLLGANPNQVTVSIETEDRGDAAQPVTERQYAAVRAAARAALMRYPSIGVVTGHDTISPHSRAHCPGDRWRKADLAQLASELRIKAY